ncbi:MAG: hypothetical protein PSX71_07585 [bacterium]|nr:hypothetical protein [bacterium]
MNTSHRNLLSRIGLLSLLLLGATAAAVDRLPEKGGAHVPPAGLVLNEGRRWGTNQPLRAGMGGIREAVFKTYHAAGKRPLNAKEGLALAEAIQNQIGYLVAYCTLAPQADAVLHILLERLEEGAAALKQNPADAKGRELILSALRNYPVYFDHPGWKPVTLP